MQGAEGEMVTVALQVRLAVTLLMPNAPKIDTRLVNATVLPGTPEKATVLAPTAVTVGTVAPDGLQSVTADGELPTTEVVGNTGLVKLHDPFAIGAQMFCEMLYCRFADTLAVPVWVQTPAMPA